MPERTDSTEGRQENRVKVGGGSAQSCRHVVGVTLLSCPNSTMQAGLSPRREDCPAATTAMRSCFVANTRGAFRSPQFSLTSAPPREGYADTEGGRPGKFGAAEILLVGHGGVSTAHSPLRHLHDQCRSLCESPSLRTPHEVSLTCRSKPEASRLRCGEEVGGGGPKHGA